MQEIPWTNGVPLLIVMVTKVNMDVFVLPRALYLIPGLHGRKYWEYRVGRYIV